ATGHIFNFSDRFVRELLPYTIELGRSFVRLHYQSSQAGAKALFALDNLWDGLGALTVEYPEIKYLFGKMTMYPSYDRTCRDLILCFLQKHFPDPDMLVWPIRPIDATADMDEMKALFTGESFKEDYRILNSEVRKHGFNIPPLVNSYMSLSPTMKMFGTAINDEFGDVEESGIFIAISDIFEEKKQRHIGTYHPSLTEI
ncbi:MAG: hemolysin, partial [Duncaniella sp.]|nr:hemolysin [Duncaniella sp.]